MVGAATARERLASEDGRSLAVAAPTKPDRTATTLDPYHDRSGREGRVVVRVREARVPDEVPVVRELFQEYAAGLGIDLCFQGFAAELDRLPGGYAPPGGGLWLAEADGRLAGCVALRRIDAERGEVKRLYVRPGFRGHGVGRALAERAVAAAVAVGYRRVCLDTLPSMTSAVGLYRSLGFADIVPYTHNPVCGALFLGRELPPPLHAVCVYCGASSGADPAFAAAAEEVGRLLAESGRTLVYGGGRVGLMGAVADAALAAGGRVVGVIPQALLDKEVGHGGLTELRVVGSMHERKAVMADLADAFLTLPGGIGTLEEFFETWTWGQLGLHAKPYGLLNVAGFFDPLLAFLDRLVDQRFVRPEHRAMLRAGADPAGMLDGLAVVRPGFAPKWLDRGET